jgi:hypothetical protein
MYFSKTPNRNKFNIIHIADKTILVFLSRQNYYYRTITKIIIYYVTVHMTTVLLVSTPESIYYS